MNPSSMEWASLGEDPFSIPKQYLILQEYMELFVPGSQPSSRKPWPLTCKESTHKIQYRASKISFFVAMGLTIEQLSMYVSN